MSFRAATGREPAWQNTGIERGFSNFLFIDRNYDSSPVMRRIFSLARKLKYQSLLVEKISETDCPLLAEENAALRLRRPDFQRSEVDRISFFRTPADHQPADFCGYVVFKRDFFAGPPQRRSHVYESVLDPPRQSDQNNFIHCHRSYNIKTSAGDFSVRGVLYAQQNDLTFVCAHVALRSALASVLPDADISYARINALVGVNHTTKTVGDSVGLGPPDFETVFNNLGIHYQKLVHEPKQQLLLPTEFQRDLYGFIESGCPALVGFELDQPNPGPKGQSRHVIPVFGHTFNEDTWLPNAQHTYFGDTLSYYPSENWLSSFVVHDDNFGPYFCMPRHFLKKENFRLMYGLKPEPTPLSAVEAEAVGFAVIQAITNQFPPRGEDWYDRFVVYTRCGWLVLRSALVCKGKYLKHLESVRTWNGTGLEPELIERLRNRLPESFWMIEASAPELFATSRRKFGEVLLVANTPLPKPLDASMLIAARLPGLTLTQNNLQLDVKPTALQSHTPLLGS